MDKIKGLFSALWAAAVGAVRRAEFAVRVIWAVVKMFVVGCFTLVKHLVAGVFAAIEALIAGILKGLKQAGVDLGMEIAAEWFLFKSLVEADAKKAEGDAKALVDEAKKDVAEIK